MEREALRRLQLVINHTKNGVIITDPDGRTTWLNPEIERLTGYSANELIGRKPGEVLQGPETTLECVQLMHEALNNLEPFETTVANYSKTGLLYWVRISCLPLYREDGKLEGFISTQVDVTRLRRLSDFNTLHAAVNQTIAQSHDDLTLFQSICDLAVRHAHLELAWIARPDETDRLIFLARAGKAVAFLDDFMVSVAPDIPEGQGTCGMTWREKTPHYSESFSTSPSLEPQRLRGHSFNIDSGATQPIFRNGKLWALFSVYHARSGFFDDDLREVLDTLARDISRGLDQIDLRTSERELANQLYQEKELAQITLVSIEDAVVTTDNEGRITFLNPKASELSGWDESEALGLPLNQVLRMLGNTADTQVLDPADEVFSSGKAINFGNNTILVARGDSMRHIESSASPIFTQQGDLRGCALIFRDVTERYEANRKLEWQANHDPLTNLPNRFALEKRLNASIENAQISGTHIAVGLLDLDDFKPVNDQYGHKMGDQLLIELARRLKIRIRDGDFLARLAGDELVVVIDHLDPLAPDTVLDAVLARLHEAVEDPFDLSSEEKVILDMSMGVATYPLDGDDTDGLIRQADAAMYSAKANKYNRAKWWRPAMLSLSNRAKDEPIDPYGPVAGDLLGKTLPYWQELENDFVEAFYERLRKHASAKRVLELLTENELKNLILRQSEHLKRLISPDLSWEAHQRMATHVGEVHAIIGVESSDIMAAMDDYGRLLRYASQKLPWRVDARLALDSIMQSRLAAEIQMQSKGRDQIEHARVANITGLEAQIHDWMEEGEFAAKVAEHLSEMPCMCGALIGRPNEQDEFVLEFKAGNLASSISALPESAQSDSLTWRKAWLSGQIVVCDRFTETTSAPEQDGMLGCQGIRSAAYIPILDAQGHSLIMIALFGTYPGQFAHSPMRMWFEAVQHMVTPAFLRIERMGEAPIDAMTRRHYHDLLFEDRLQIVVHPIVTLATGEVEKVEVLARLRDGDQLLTPATFLPSFGKQDLQALFRKGLRQIMDWMVIWDKQGLCLDVNLNLPPSVLISRGCARWVEEELSTHDLKPTRLYLELLETEDVSGVSLQRDEAISQLAEMGVRLVMDDLGSGYSSLQRMRMLPFHSVKLDQELVRHATSEPERTIPFIGSLVRMAQSIGLEVVLEGLESLDMIDMASRLGADYGQGYAFSQPFLPEDLPTWISDWQDAFSLAELSTPLGALAASFIDGN